MPVAARIPSNDLGRSRAGYLCSPPNFIFPSRHCLRQALRQPRASKRQLAFLQKRCRYELVSAAAQTRSCLPLYVRLQQYSSSRASIQLCIALAATLAPALALMAAACLIARICAQHSFGEMGSRCHFLSQASVTGSVGIATCRMQTPCCVGKRVILHPSLTSLT